MIMTALLDSLKPQVTMKQSVHDSSVVAVSVVANFNQVLSCKNKILERHYRFCLNQLPFANY